jgi:hypothetical protein
MPSDSEMLTEVAERRQVAERVPLLSDISTLYKQGTLELNFNSFIA